MKTAISIPDGIFAAAERLARRLHRSRSELYVTALRTYLEKCKQADVTERLNALYDEKPSRLDSALKTLQARSVGSEAW